jgi:hypothetical protein
MADQCENRFVLSFDDKTLTIHINGRLVAAYPAAQLGHAVLDDLFVFADSLILRPDRNVPFEDLIHRFQIPTIGPCTICGGHANLLGGLCYTCFHNPDNGKAQAETG